MGKKEKKGDKESRAPTFEHGTNIYEKTYTQTFTRTHEGEKEKRSSRNREKRKGAEVEGTERHGTRTHKERKEEQKAPLTGQLQAMTRQRGDRGRGAQVNA